MTGLANPWKSAIAVAPSTFATPGAFNNEQMAHSKVLAPAKPSSLRLDEDSAAYHLSLPVRGIDLRNLHIFTSPRSVSIELRTRRSFPHQSEEPIQSDAEIQRICREVRFRERIERGKAHASMAGNTLHITLPKATSEEDGNWSEWITFDTRASLGCISTEPQR
jgi:HSP20 family molecular chaperone IbpA